jgi:hypothetical protein
LKSENLKKLLGKENTKIGETQELLISSYSTITKQVSNNSQHFSILYFGGTLCRPIFVKRRNRNSFKMYHSFRGSKSRKDAPKFIYIYIAKIP